MADSQEPSFRRPATASNASHLRYPTLPPLSGSVEEWLSRSRPIAMTSTPPPEQPSKSLSESWATLSASDIHSEDGARSELTDAGSLIDQPGPDDVASLDERYSCSETDGNDEEPFDGDGYDSNSNVSDSQELPSLFSQLRGSIDDSNITAKTAFRPPVESIEFTEPEEWPAAERVELKQRIRTLEDFEAAELQRQLPFSFEDSTLMATAQQTMTKRSLDTDKPFRVLYVGSPDFRNIILDKIGDVLVSSTCSGFESSSTESSRYHVVPTSYGVGAVPNFAELLPIHVQLIVDECLEASSDSHESFGAIVLNFKNRPASTSTWTGREYSISSRSEWTLPDVAIIFVSNADTPATTEAQRLARIAMERHDIPTMIISERPLWKMTKEPIPLNHNSLHMCLESRHKPTGKMAVVRRYPIDLKTFESVTPSQLNRNLASLASNNPKQICKITAREPQPAQSTLFLESKKYAMRFSPLAYLGDKYGSALPLCLLGLTFLSAMIIGFSPSAISNNLERSGLSTVPPTSVMPVDDQRRTSLSVSVMSSTFGMAQISGSQSHGPGRLEDLLGEMGLSSEQRERSDGFEIQVVGDCHLVIKPPRKTPTSKKQPKFGVQVSRREKILTYELSKLFEDVYSLKLDRGDAYGIVNVTITTQSKAPVNETITVDLGTPWLKIANWKRAAQVITSQLMRDFSTAHNGFSEAYGRLFTDLQVLMGDVVKRAHVLRREADELRRDSLGLSIETRDVVLGRSKQLSEAIKRNAVQPFLAASSVLQDHTNKVNREAKEIMSDTWKRISTRAHGLDTVAWKDHVRNARKCQALDRAQKKAKGLMHWTHLPAR
ncbi:hypothetical protein P170DRAFT_362996 [Aspergillus steynii IBT 23096]|uniref:Uncharacterized protein n=1 Tax=Aspergillus steynii IBT 23096 TaxID=1392250 RepID=A0A2I2G386_9EURO|nr:uncharacterized protein P170DRAFT_362996 [Aspergillus steynii IBT 23096]PLB47317.1 hypothetical protein P170DRAFT_362996 [Aspergillus steynii IBT 23096]